MAAEQYSETEVKVFVTDLATVAAKLAELGAELTVPRVYERNVRYENADNTFTGQGIVLRLREDNKIKLTYKEPLDPLAAARGIHRRFEAEVTVSDYGAMDTILTRLGFHPYMVYEKYRTTYALNGAEIVLDEMPYGDFVEIEGSEATINALLEKLNLQDQPRISYSYAELFDRIKTALQLDVDDLTFDNFDGVTV
ncbi:MAG: class IV adenylate cyclase, partial [Chloroflexota bacterium]